LEKLTLQTSTSSSLKQCVGNRRRQYWHRRRQLQTLHRTSLQHRSQFRQRLVSAITLLLLLLLLR